MLKKILIITATLLILTGIAAYAETENSITVSVTTNQEGAVRLHDFLVRNGYAMPAQLHYFKPETPIAATSWNLAPILPILFWIFVIIGFLWIMLKIIRRIMRVLKEYREEAEFADNITYLETNPIGMPHKGFNLSERLGNRYYA